MKNFIYHLRFIRGQILIEPLNRGHRFQLTWDYVKWILFFKHSKKEWQIEFENGYRSIVKPYPDHDSGSMNIWTRNVDYYDIEFVRRVLKKGDSIIDAGCNVGNRTWAMADIISSAILIDANVNAIARTRENLRLNRLPEDKFILLQNALGDKEGTIRFSDRGGARTDNRILGEDAESESFTTVPMTTIDAIVAKYDYRPAFIKLDVEGYDLFALRGAIRTLSYGCVRLVKFEVLDVDSVKDFEDLFRSIGWKMFALDKKGRPTEDKEYFKQLNLFAAPAALADKYLKKAGGA